MTDTKNALNPALIAPLDGTPRYLTLADRIAAAVEDGRLAVGEQLPPVRELAWALGIGVGAVARAYRIGTSRGHLEATVGRGTFVRGVARPRYAIEALIDTAAPDNIDLRGNQAVDVGQDADIGAALARILDRHGGAPPLLGYRRREDDMDLIEILADWLREGGVPADAERLLVTSGAQAGVIACLASLARGGSGIVLATPTLHPGLIDGGRTIGVRFEAVSVDDEGPLPDAFEAAIERFRPDAAQFSATLHNPTLALMGPERRRAIAEIARRHSLPIVEDDVYGRLIRPRPESFASLMPELCWYVTSFSKCVAAGLRAGFILTPPGRTTVTLRAYQAIAHQTPWIVKALAAELVRGGEAMAIEQRVIAETAERATLTARILARHGVRTHVNASFAWLPLAEGWTAAEFVATAADAGVLVPPPAIYSVTRGIQPFTRLAIGGRCTRSSLEEGLRRLERVLAEGPHPAEFAT
ncbi:MAG: PLP-dependent aminotransferase family protein [Pseudomonadota bacterium]